MNVPGCFMERFAEIFLRSLAQYKGGPSKGGFLNNRSFSYADLYLCNEINGMCI